MLAGDKAPRATARREPAHWLIKSEPSAYGWDDLKRDGRTAWTGVRNHQAAIWLRAMRLRDTGLFYHSNTGLEAVGIFEVVKESYLDPTDPAGRFVAIDVAPRQALAKPVTLAAMKATPALREMAMLRQFRLSVVPISAHEWATILAMAA